MKARAVPIKDDYLMRQLERLAQFVAAAIAKAAGLSKPAALEEIHRAYRELFQIDPRFAHLVDPAALGDRAEEFLRLRRAEQALLAGR